MENLNPNPDGNPWVGCCTWATGRKSRVRRPSQEPSKSHRETKFGIGHVHASVLCCEAAMPVLTLPRKWLCSHNDSAVVSPGHILHVPPLGKFCTEQRHFMHCQDIRAERGWKSQTIWQVQTMKPSEVKGHALGRSASHWQSSNSNPAFFWLSSQWTLNHTFPWWHSPQTITEHQEDKQRAPKEVLPDTSQLRFVTHSLTILLFCCLYFWSFPYSACTV